jgi:hypothetical protein
MVNERLIALAPNGQMIARAENMQEMQAALVDLAENCSHFEVAQVYEFLCDCQVEKQMVFKISKKKKKK